MLRSRPGEGRRHFAEKAGEHSGGSVSGPSKHWKRGLGLLLGCSGRNYELSQGRDGVEDGSFWPPCSRGPASCAWHFPVFFLQPPESLFITSQSWDRSPKFLPANVAALALPVSSLCLGFPERLVWTSLRADTAMPSPVVLVAG